MKHSSAHSVWTDAPSGYRQLVGYRLIEWSEGRATLELTIGPRHLSRASVIHGGVIATLIDAAAGYSGIYCAIEGRVRRAATVSLNVQYIAPARAGTIRAHARVRGGGKRLFMSSVEVVNSNGELLAIGEAVYRYRAGSEDPAGVPMEQNGEKRETDLG